MEGVRAPSDLAPRAKRGRHGSLVKKLDTDDVREGPVFDVCKRICPWTGFTVLQANRSLTTAWHADPNADGGTFRYYKGLIGPEDCAVLDVMSWIRAGSWALRSH